MQCDQFEHRLNDVLDRRDDPRRDARLVAHAASCNACRNLAAAYETLTEGATELRNLGSVPLVYPIGERRLRRNAIVGALFATAAAAAFLLYRPVEEGAPLAALPSPVPVHEITPKSVALDSASSTEPDPPVVVDLARTTSRAYVGLIHGTARSFDDALALAAVLPPAHELLQPMLFPEDGLLRRMESRLAPVAGETIHVLQQVFQSQDSQQL